jgi:hypothetical protein
MALINPPMVDVVPPGSSQFILRGLLPSTTYTYYIYHLDPMPGRSFSTPLVGTFTTPAAQATAQTPTNPTGITGRTDASGMYRVDGTFGIEVTPMEFPSTIILQVAVETAIGSGVPAGFVDTTFDIAKVAANTIVNRTRLTATAANDQLKRFVRAYATRRGAIQSAYTTAITLDPWSANPAVTPNLLIAGTLSGPQ